MPFFFFFFNDTATTEIYTLSLHDALPICTSKSCQRYEPSTPYSSVVRSARRRRSSACGVRTLDRKSTRLNSSHSQISYAVFCLKKKKQTNIRQHKESGAGRSRGVPSTRHG